VGLLGRILRFIIWVLVATWVGRRLFGWLFGAAQQSAQRPANVPAPGGRRQLYRDPVCGTHVPAEISLTLQESGQTHHFCSAECRNAFAAEHREAPRRASA
jgi:YHS domain-containing protein